MNRLLHRACQCTAVLLLATSTLASALTPSGLPELVAQRLNMMKAVAAYKWQNKIPIDNLERESYVLDKAVEQGLRYGLTTDSTRRFFYVQILAAKEVQQYWFGQWRSSPDSLPLDTPDLNRNIRPALIKLGQAISSHLVNGRADLTNLQVEGLSQKTKGDLHRSAAAVQTYPNRLKQVLDSKILRVGTTGDYAPFSFRPDSVDNSAQFSGIDIDLAKNLAAALGAEIQWVHTSWPTLMPDLNEGLYDIGMSGISINLQRQQSAYFSDAYQSGGKSPLIRCADKSKYASLSNIDRGGTRVIVNPGGTNYKFAMANIHKAKIQLHNDNRSIFDEIVNNNADVMITDQIEVQLQVAKHPELCAAMGEQTLSFSEKGFLLPQDIVWKEYVDAWLNMRRGDGTVKKVFSEHL